jgi:hypothetical protein
VKRWIFLVLGIVLVLVGVLWTLQGFNAMGQSGGMNGHKIYAVIGIIVGLVGLGLLGTSARSRRSNG